MNNNINNNLVFENVSPDINYLIFFKSNKQFICNNKKNHNNNNNNNNNLKSI